MSDITIPPAALEAGRKAFANAGTAEDDRDPFAEACLAMLKAWPKAERIYRSADEKLFTIILSLPTENTNAEG